jgi:hypothetical protein
MKTNTPNNIITYLYAHTSRSFKEFIGSFYQFKPYSNNYLITKEYIFTDNIKPTLTPDILDRKYLTPQIFHKISRIHKRLENLISLFIYKFKTITKIRKVRKDKIIEIVNAYKELARTITIPKNKDFTHMVSISYRHKIYTDDTLTDEQIFEIMQENEEIIRKFNRGIHRLRNYVYKYLKDRLKKRIKDKKRLNERVKKLKEKVFNYFKVYELHKSHHLHIHMLIKLPKFIRKMRFKEIISKFAKWFETEPQGIDIKRIRKNKDDVVGYILKYMYKQFNNGNMFYIETEKKEKIIALRTDALIRNEIKRMISHSRNVKTEKIKPFFKYKEEKNEKNEKETIEVIRIERELQKRHHGEFKEYLKDFKTTREKLLEYEIEQAEKRTEVLEKLKDFLDDRYFSIKDVLRCLDFCKLDKIIQDRFYTIYQQAMYKFNRLLEELEEERQEIEIVDF